jgi:pectate lyase
MRRVANTGLSLIESNVFEPVNDPVTSRDSSEIGSGTSATTSAAVSPETQAARHGERHGLADHPGIRLDGYSYTLTPVSSVKTNVIATAGAGTNLAENEPAARHSMNLCATLTRHRLG